MITLLTLQNLSYSIPHRALFKNTSFSLLQGEKVGVLGLNGHGKSTLFKIISGEVTPDTTIPPFNMDINRQFTFFLVPQELVIHEEDTIETYYEHFYPDIASIKKELHAIEEKMAVADEAELNRLIDRQSHLFDRLHELGDDRISQSYTSYLKLFGLVDLHRGLHHLSGGEQRKIALSLGLSAPQEVILWDEPTNHLDLQTIELFEDELMNNKKTLMMISHDRTLLNNVCDRIIHIQHGIIQSFKGTYGEYLTFLQQQEEERAKHIDKLENNQRRETAWIRRGAKARRTKSKKRIEDYSVLKDRIQELKNLAHRSVKIDLKTSGRKTRLLFEMTEVSLRFGERVIFDKLNLTLNQGQKIAIIGRNGAGKSSLLKLITGEILPDSGHIKRAHELSVGLFAQKRDHLPMQASPFDYIGEGVDFVISNTGERRHVISYLENFLFPADVIKRPIYTFSGGEKNRLQLAKFMKDGKDLWIFDEPTNDLDLETIGILEDELKSYEGGLLIVGHDRTFLENTVDECWVVHDGGVSIFPGGFEQGQAFLQALELEKVAQKMRPESKNSAPSETPKKLSYQEQKMKEELPLLIEKLESDIEQLELELAQAMQKGLSPNDLKKESDKISFKIKKKKDELETHYDKFLTL
jgi:ABC transport system ATP-binding/permease protein